MQCLNITNKSCTKTFKVASTNCNSYHNIENIEYDGDIGVFREFGECVVTEFIKYNDIQKQKYEKCEHIIQAHLQEYVDQARIQSNEYDKKFFEEDDHLHSNEK